MDLPVHVRVAELKAEISLRIFGEELSEVAGVPGLDGAVAGGAVEFAPGFLHETGSRREARRNTGRVGDHPHGVLEQVVPNHRKLVGPQKMARGLRHRRYAPLVREISE